MGIGFSSVPRPGGVGRATILLVDDDPFQAYAHRLALQSNFASLERATDASEALIRVESREFAKSLALIVVGLRLPGLAGPVFVSELIARAPSVPVVVLGRAGETAADYGENNVRFLPPEASSREFLAEIKSLLPKGLARVS